MSAPTSTSGVLLVRRGATRLPIVASCVLRAIIAAAFVYALANPSLPQLQDAATRARMIAWPFGLVVVPIALRLLWRKRPYPWTVDAVLALPFALDASGNVLNLYHSWAWYDTLNHGVSWCAVALLATLAPAAGRLPPWARAAVALGAGAAAAIMWELGEFVAFIHDSGYGSSAYADTLTDLSAGLVGASVAGAVSALGADTSPKIGD
jgi:hypothetical protein